MWTTRLSYLLIAFLLVSAKAQAATTLVAAPATVTLNYTKLGTLPTARVTIGPSSGTSGSIYFTIAASSLPPWVQVDKTNGTSTATAPLAVTFSPSLVAANSPTGTYSAQVQVDSTGLASIFVTVNLVVTNAAPTVTANLVLSTNSWTPGSTPPTGILTVKSSGDPVYFSVTATPSWIVLGASSAVAYSWGTNIAVTFAQSAFDNPTVNGPPLSGSLVVKVGTLTLPTIGVSIAIGQPVATISSISPKQLPQNTGGGFRTVAIQGSSFANGMTVKLGGATGTSVTSNCATFATSTTDAWCLQSNQQFFLRLSPAMLASAANTGNKLDLYLSTDPNGHIDIPVVTTPIVNAVTDAASFQQPASGNLNIAAYEMLSFFGDNFGTPASPIAFTSGRLPASLMDASLNALRIHFTDSSGFSLMADWDGYLLLWTPTQINVLVPSTLPGSSGGGEVKATVMVGSASSSATVFNVMPASPALLTFGAGQAVVVNADNSINTSTNPAKVGTSVLLYLSGMGVPYAGGSSVGGTLAPLPAPGGCADYAGFQAAMIGLYGWSTFDGAVVPSSVLGTAFPPCFDPATVSVKIGSTTLGSSAVTYAGFTGDTIAGLYQVNVTIPASITPAPVATPSPYSIQVSIAGASSQPGVNIYLAR